MQSMILTLLSFRQMDVILDHPANLTTNPTYRPTGSETRTAHWLEMSLGWLGGSAIGRHWGLSLPSTAQNPRRFLCKAGTKHAKQTWRV